MEPKKINILLLDEAKLFIRNISDEKARKKVVYNMLKVENGERNQDLFKKLEGSEIWEFRTLFNGNSYRLFAFWDNVTGSLIVATHGLLKKTQKTPQGEITKAEAIRKEYFESLNNPESNDKTDKKQ